jgi:N-hydroxyarylamine O-acetyltransferase
MLFHDNYESGLENWLTTHDVNAFFSLIKIKQENPDLIFLTKLIRAIFKRVPFQNFTMLARPRIAPTPNEIIHDMLTGIGGLCTTINPFICSLLHRLGFKAGLLSASMDQPDCHICILVEIEDTPYWIDLGNGFPYLTPLKIKHCETAKFLNFQYQIDYTNHQVKIHQNILGNLSTKTNQTFTPTPVHYSHFDDLRLRHYQDSGYGPFLTGLRANRWQTNAGYLMRDQLLWNIPGKIKKANNHEISDWLAINFNNNKELIRMFKKSWEILHDANHNK